MLIYCVFLLPDHATPFYFLQLLPVRAAYRYAQRLRQFTRYSRQPDGPERLKRIGVYISEPSSCAYQAITLGGRRFCHLLQATGEGYL